MIFNETILKGNYLIELQPVYDERGWFARTYCDEEFKQIGHSEQWLQMNHSLTRCKGTIRGMHFQRPPHGEIKLVRCIAGAVYDVVVDIRTSSPTFLQWFGAELSAENKMMMYIPEGFAHGFQTLTDNAELIYAHSKEYVSGCEGGLSYQDKALKIEWPLPANKISDRDKQHPLIDKNFTGL